MTTRLDTMIADLAGGILDAADTAPVDLRHISARLPIEFGLRQGETGPVVSAQPPEAIQSRDLSIPVGQFAFTLDIKTGGGHG